MTIYGDLNIEDGATVEFLGNNSMANIFGSVNKSGNATVTGTFLDVKDKF
ncbi:hypothetical protein NYZ99_09730 [Maribacter litopenaei]|uniref:Polymer-forming protein n=1 Tax=Maribacter litopenaei TaxID=2976127 RepID=A0ABY5YE88_9FLAO|nr:hypothetical protein [Maribacter litopenaei]UWX56435.1 hypothetical protein NYZ99_09730 [Maribacter litopenaei]